MNALATLFASILACLRDIGGRSRRMELKLDRLLIITERMEQTMAENDSTILAELEKLKTSVNDRTTKLGEQLAAAHADLASAEAKGRAAQKTEDEEAAAADKAAALAKIKEISDGLVAFQASGN
ncbi:hypothetical protein MKK84_19495 [Methylobacterium sp. E-065]|uniref:hypothetical protein n=1 Tax=Methylobacterium sp. E-065 TaxID=2836583 RepID=UPI001FBBFC0B|nr:hypothetical protein [Methylobacterium sp. E-065]MCJ2019591.1 hypothetical protein [Methylobacterium sp. E-065]